MRCSPLFRACIFIAFAIAHAGCALPEVGDAATRRIGDPPRSMDRAKFACEGPEECLALGKASRATTKQQVRTALGEPDGVEIAGGTEKWSYRNDPRRRGWGILVVVPGSLLPAAAAHEKLTVEFVGDLVRYVELSY